MTLQSVVSRNDYTGTGSTDTYPYTFKIFDEDDLLVTERVIATGVETTLAIGVDYTVSGVGDPTGGNVTLLAGNLPATKNLAIRRVVPLTQLTDIRNFGAYFRDVHEDTFDLSRMVDQQQQDEIDRSVKLPESFDPAVVDTELPSPAAGQSIRWDSGATALESYDPAAAGTLVLPGGNGILVKTAPLTTVARTLTPGSGVKIDDGDGVAANPVISATGDYPMNARLTLESGVPVSATDQTAKTTVYLTPFRGNIVALYDGSAWAPFSLTEISIAVPATTDTVYDLFVYDSSGLTLEAVAWTDDTNRATALALQDGVYVKTAAPERRYVGTFRTTGVSGQTEDSEAKRYLWNYYNRVKRKMVVIEATDSWSGAGSSFAQANASTANQLDFVIGVAEDIVDARVVAHGLNATDAAVFYVGIGLDSTSAHSGDLMEQTENNDPSAIVIVKGQYSDIIAAGRHFLAWLERHTAGSMTWYGDNGGTNLQSGIVGTILG